MSITTGGRLPPLPLSVEPGSARLTLADREAEAITAAGLKGIGAAAGGMGRHGLDRALRILPGMLQGLASGMRTALRHGSCCINVFVDLIPSKAA